MGFKKFLNKVTSDMIIKDFIRISLRKRKQNRIFHNLYFGSWEADILEVTTSGYRYEYEVKTTKADFYADARKSKHQRGFFNVETKRIERNADVLKHDIIQQGKRTNYFYFVVPDGLVKAEDVPEWAGLIYYEREIHTDVFNEVSNIYCTFKTIKKARLLHHNKITNKQLIDHYESIYFKHYRNI